MTSHKAAIGAALAGLLVVGTWFAWNWCTTPAVPPIHVDSLAPEFREPLTAALRRVRQTPRSAEAWGELSSFLVANQLNDLALPCLAQTERLEPNEARWPYWRGLLLTVVNHDEAIPLLRRALTLAHLPDNQAGILFRLSLALIENDDLDEADQRLQMLAALKPDSGKVHYGLGLLAKARGDQAAARAHFGRLVDHPQAPRRRVHALLATLTDGDVARSHMLLAEKLPPDPPWQTAFESELQRYKVEVIDRLAEFYALGRAGREAEAVDWLRKLAADSPDEEVCFALGYTLLSRNQLEESEQQLRKAIEFNSKNDKAHMFLGIALFLQAERKLQDSGGKDQALAWFRQSVQALDQSLLLKDNSSKAYLHRGLALKQMGQMDACLQSLRKAVEYGADDASAHLALGEALAEAGRYPEALKCLQDAVNLADPRDSRPRQALQKWNAKAKAPM